MGDGRPPHEAYTLAMLATSTYFIVPKKTESEVDPTGNGTESEKSRKKYYLTFSSVR